ncbi:hypothetical protein S40288_10797 [Stachybotrys chartarum IBT 40288]|nr:hypothetical protein S40288_10797 [Stachybotrys chartarum IBT 40288]
MEVIAATANAPEYSDPVVGRLNDWLDGMGGYALRVCKTGALRCSPAPKAACWPIGETYNADRCTYSMHHLNAQRLCVPCGVSKVAPFRSTHVRPTMNASNRQDQDVDPRGLRRTAAAVGRVGRQTQPWTAELLPRLGEPCQYATIPFGPRFRNFTPAPAPA